jgi:hypothetical protein
MLECFKIRVVSPCSRAQTRANTETVSCATGDGQNDGQDELKKTDSQIMSVRWMIVKTNVDADGGRVE